MWHSHFQTYFCKFGGTFTPLLLIVLNSQGLKSSTLDYNIWKSSLWLVLALSRCPQQQTRNVDRWFTFSFGLHSTSVHRHHIMVLASIAALSWYWRPSPPYHGTSVHRRLINTYKAVLGVFMDTATDLGKHDENQRTHVRTGWNKTSENCWEWSPDKALVL